MRHVTTFRDSLLVKNVTDRILSLPLSGPVRIMEVCGGHTAAIYRYALHSLLPEQVELVSGPGCPVCVTPIDFVDHAVELAGLRDLTIVTFGDLLRVPGSACTLSEARGSGLDIQVIYSSADALRFAEQHPRRLVILLGIGFETTACTIAATMRRANQKGVENLKLLSGLKTMPAALNALLRSKDTCIDGLILPGHVCTVTGTIPFEFIAGELNIPCAVSGFEPSELLDCIHAICLQKLEGSYEVQNRYRRAVQTEGNRHAQDAINSVFQSCDSIWRGLGAISCSGLSLRPEYAAWDAEHILDNRGISKENRACRCGDVLCGRIHPRECPLFAGTCSPDSPMGACMVSSEGACAAVYQYQTEYA